MDDRREPIGAGNRPTIPAVNSVLHGRPLHGSFCLVQLWSPLAFLDDNYLERSLRTGTPLPARRSGDPRPSCRRQLSAQGAVLLRVYHGISEDRILLVAAVVTFYAILALFPGIGAIVSIYGLFADPSRIVTHLDTLSGFAPSGAVDVLRECPASALMRQIGGVEEGRISGPS